ncbi:MAG: hypothetical protein KAQ96_03655, partial [Thermoplasmata archaeon]|nr:hypothetical protein [Thermoplasmata archaeon]
MALDLNNSVPALDIVDTQNTPGYINGDPPEIIDGLNSISGHFLENLGQLSNNEIKYYAQGDPLTVGLTCNGIVFTLRSSDRSSMPSKPDPETSRYTSFTLMFEGCEPVKPFGVGTLDHRTNYIIGNEPDRWVRGATSYSEVLYEGIYPGVDLRFYFMDGMFKYDLILQGDIDPNVIQLRYHGIEDLEVDEASGDLLIITSVGTIRDTCPIAYQT